MPGKQNVCYDTRRDGGEYIVPVHAYSLISPRSVVRRLAAAVIFVVSLLRKSGN
jgi:hypothetical protein